MKPEDIAKLGDEEITQEIIDKVHAGAKRSWFLMCSMCRTTSEQLAKSKDPQVLIFLDYYRNAKEAALELNFKFEDFIGVS